MVKIFTESLTGFSKIFGQVRTAGVSYFEYVFLDFDKKTLSFYNDSTAVKISLDLEILSEEPIDSIFIEGNKFFSLISLYDVLIYKGRGVFATECGNNFTLPILEEKLDFFEKENYSLPKFLMTVTPSFIKDLKIHDAFLDRENALQGLFFRNGFMISLSETKVIYSKSPFEDDAFLTIPQPIAKILTLLKFEEGDVIEFRISKNGGVEFNYGKLFLKFSASQDLSLPADIFSREFTEAFDHEEYFTFKTEDIKELLKIFGMFFNLDTSHTKVSFLSDDLCRFSVIADSTVDYNLALQSVSKEGVYSDKHLWISIFGFISAVNSLIIKGAEEIKVQFNEGAPAVLFSNSTKGKEDTYIIQTLTEDPSI